MPLQQSTAMCEDDTTFRPKEFKFDELAQCVQRPPMQYPSPPICNMMPMTQPLMPSISNITPNANISQITAQPNPMDTPPDVPKLIESIRGGQEDRLIAIPKPGN
ncbi:hypothetical protein GPJ56_009146 [Histomonas meleagridis]|nr:hypothetical protein GPJ56_009146 [Histomonas meleagridis]